MQPLSLKTPLFKDEFSDSIHTGSFRVRDLSNGPNTAGTKRAEQPYWLSCVARFERSAGVLADRGDLTNQFADRVAS